MGWEPTQRVGIQLVIIIYSKHKAISYSSYVNMHIQRI